MDNRFIFWCLLFLALVAFCPAAASPRFRRQTASGGATNGTTIASLLTELLKLQPPLEIKNAIENVVNNLPTLLNLLTNQTIPAGQYLTAPLIQTLQTILTRGGNVIGDTLQKSLVSLITYVKAKAERIEPILKEYLSSLQDTTQELKSEAQEFLRPYREDLGTIFEELKKSLLG